MKQNQNRIEKYFSQKSHSFSLLIAVALLILGFCVIILLPPHFWALGLTLMAAGGLIWLFLNLQIKDSELGEAARAAQAAFKEKFEYEFIYRDTRKLHQAELRGIRHKEPIYESSYLMSGEGLLTRRGGDGKMRSSVYQCVGILKEDDYICFGTQNFSLIGGEESAPVLNNYPYTALSRVALGEADDRWHLTTMTVYTEGGTALMTFQMRADAQTDDLVADINAKIQKAFEERSSES